jgi:hypothetical protein
MKSALMPIGLALIAPLLAWPHEGHHHGAHTHAEKERESSQLRKAALEGVNQKYLNSVKPIFAVKCLACHASGGEPPWYSILPGVHQLIERDVRESREHLDMIQDFPFGGHGTPEEDLDAIRKSILDGSMPPFRYKLVHWSSGLTDSEKTAVLKWADEGLAAINGVHQP